MSKTTLDGQQHITVHQFTTEYEYALAIDNIGKSLSSKKGLFVIRPF